jgi:hypothetical protein
MAMQPISQGPWLKGLVASNQPLSQPKGSFPRGSNLLMMERGGLTPCDGSGIINWFNAAVQSTQGRFMSVFLYEPTGVNPYYLVLAQALDQHLNFPKNVSAADAGTGGTLGAGTYWYKITALDGVGGETNAPIEAAVTIAANHKITISWSFVPNAFGYNVYRGTSSGTEVLLVAANLPKIQPNPIMGTVSFTDDGSPLAGTTFSAGAYSITVGASRYTFFTWTTPFLGSVNQLTSTGFTPSSFNATFNIITMGTLSAECSGGPGSGTGTGGTVTLGSTSPPVSNTTRQTVLFQMPIVGQIPISYSNANIVALFPASISSLGQVPTGGTGGAGTTGAGITGLGSSTPSGGVAGLVGPLPQFKQFTNRAVIALGNGFAPQLYSDSTGTTVNQAFTGAITAISVDAFGLVTVTTSAALTTTNMPVGSNTVLATITNALYNGTFVIVSVNTGAGTFTLWNVAAIGQAASSGGTFTLSTTPIISTFIPAYPTWIASSAFAVGDIIVPVTQPANPIYLTTLQPGTSGTSEPGWNTPQPAIGQQFKDNNIIWTVTALLNAGAPAPPGAGHIEVYAGSLWVLNTSPTNTANGLDGPCALRMSNANNPNGWNPVNQAFLDKDDGAEGMGLGKFTITAQGIPPEGSLIAFKYRVPYQIIGVFGANNFAIQPISSDMGCLAPRSILFIPGYGLMRYCHLGIAVFDGWKDQVISEQIRPYLFPVNNFDAQDITVADANYLPLSWAAQTANPPMYAFAMPIGNSGGQLTRIMPYDLVLKAWAAPVDLPFPIGCMTQVQPVTSNPITIIGGFNDGALQRWQAGDVNWYTGGGASAVEVKWLLRTVTVASQNSSQRIWVRKLIIRGTGSNSDTDPFTIITVQPRVSTVAQTAVNYKVATTGDFDLFADVGLTGLRFDAVISGDDHLEIDGIDWLLEPRPVGVPVAAI